MLQQSPLVKPADAWPSRMLGQFFPGPNQARLYLLGYNLAPGYNHL